MLAATLLFAAFVIQLVPDVSDAARDLVRTIPLVCDARKSLLVPVRVNGLDVRPFLLDTGSSVTTIDERLISRLSLPTAGRIASSSGSDPLVTAQLAIGPVTLPAGPVVALNLRRVSHVIGEVSGILGSDALRAMGRTTIDFDRCQLSVGGAATDNEDRRSELRRASRVPLEWHQGRPIATMTGGIRMLLDSGATDVIVFNDTTAGKSMRWRSIETEPVRIDRFDGLRLGRIGVLTALAVGGIELPNVRAVGVKSWYQRSDNGAPDGILPLGLFSRVVISHDEGYAILVPGSRVPVSH
jgi:hypothetical protein